MSPFIILQYYNSVFDYQHITFNHCVIPLYGTVITLSAHIKCIILNIEIYYHGLKNTETGDKVITCLEAILGLKA